MTDETKKEETTENVEREVSSVEEKRKRRRRVSRMKSGIFSFLVVWIIVSCTAIVLLSFGFFSLENQVRELKKDLSSREVQKTENSSSVSPGAEKLVKNDYTTDEDNLRDADDVLKVYLTFDDGPSNNSDRILDTLDDYDVKATFFVNGREDEHSLSIYRRIVNEGHTIGMHSYSHDYGQLYASLDSFRTDYDRIHQLILDTTGVDSKWYRFPGGSSNEVSATPMADLIRFLDDRKVNYMDWNVSSGDAVSGPYTADDVIENVMKDVVRYKTSVVLLHDSNAKTATAEALPRLIEELEAKGALILPISDDTKLIQHVTLTE